MHVKDLDEAKCVPQTQRWKGAVSNSVNVRYMAESKIRYSGR